MKRLLFGMLVLLTASTSLKAQTCYLLNDAGKIIRLNINDCSYTYVNTCTAMETSGATDIAFDKNNNLYFVIQGGQLIRKNLDSNGSCELVAYFNTFINSLTADSTGKIYAAADALYVYDPATGNATNLGTFPPGISAAGDLSFFNGQLYMAATAGIVKVNISNPSASTLYIPGSNTDVFGIITVPSGCNQYKTYMTSNSGTTTDLIEVDLANGKIAGTKCTLPNFVAYGAASVTESGTANKLAIDKLTVSASCPANNNGFVNIDATGAGVLQYSFDGASPSEKDSLSPAAGGYHTITVLDETGCTKDTFATVPVSTAIRYTLTINNATCSYTSDGKATLSLLAGDGDIGYTINKDTYTKNPVFESLAAGKYTLDISQNNHCFYDTSFTIQVPPAPELAVQLTPACNGIKNGVAELTIASGQPPFLYGIDHSSFNSSSHFTNIAGGPHMLHVQDSKGCRYDTAVTVEESRIGFTATASDIQCGHKGFVDISDLSGYTPLLISFNNAAFLPDSSFKNLTTGVYDLRIKDGNNCIADTSFVIKLNTYPCVDSLFFPTAFTPNNDGHNDVFRPLTISQPKYYHFQVMNRWGQVVFETSDISAGWDGKCKGTPQPTGVYVWIAKWGNNAPYKRISNSVLLIR